MSKWIYNHTSHIDKAMWDHVGSCKGLTVNQMETVIWNSNLDPWELNVNVNLQPHIWKCKALECFYSFVALKGVSLELAPYVWSSYKNWFEISDCDQWLGWIWKPVQRTLHATCNRNKERGKIWIMFDKNMLLGMYSKSCLWHNLTKGSLSDILARDSLLAQKGLAASNEFWKGWRNTFYCTYII